MDKKEAVNFDSSGHTATIHDWSPVDESGRHKSSQEIEHDIEETRHSMDLILDALNGKGSPGSLYNKVHDYFQNEQNREKVQKTLSRVSDSVSNSFQRNPLPVIMVAAGASWMLWELNQPSHDGKTGEKVQRFRSQTGEKTEAAKEKAGERIDTAKERTGALASEAQKKAGSFFDHTRQRGEEYRERATDLQARAKSTYQRADTSVHSNSLLFGVAAACAGIVAGLMLPETRTESRYAEELAPETKQKTEKSEPENVNVSNKAPVEKVDAEKLSQQPEKIILEPGVIPKKTEEKPVNPGDTKAK